VSDIFREVEEDVRRERLEKWWKKYGDYVIAGVSVVVIGVAGYKLWQHYTEQQRLKASSEYQSAIQLGQSGQYAVAEQAFARIAKHAPSGYVAVAELARADSLVASGKTAEGIALYMKIAGNNEGGLGDVARVRAAWTEADSLSAEELRTLLAPVNTPDSSWRYMAREILAYRDYRDGRLQQAQDAFASLAATADAPAGVRQRAKAMATFIRNGGDENYGTVPPPAAAQPQGTPNP